MIFGQDLVLGWSAAEGDMRKGLVTDIVDAYSDLRKSMAEQKNKGVGEERLLAFVSLACFFIFLSFLPKLISTDLSANPEQSLFAGIIVWFFAVMFFLPLILYGVAAISHLIARFFNGTASFFEARHALFWALVVLSPVFLLRGMLGSVVLQLNGDIFHIINSILNFVLAFAIVRVWGAFLAEVENFNSVARVCVSIISVIVALFALIYAIGHLSNN